MQSPRAHLLDVTHYEDGAERLRQIIDSPLQDSLNLMLSSCALGVRVWGDHWRPTNLHISAIYRGVDEVDCAPLPPPSLPRLIERNSREPRRYARITTEINKPGEGPNICILHNVFCFAVVQKNAPRDAVKVAIVSSDQDTKRRWVSIKGASEKFAIARLAHV